MMFYATKKAAMKKAEDISHRTDSPIYVIKGMNGYMIQKFEKHDEWEKIIAIFQRGDNKIKK